MNVFIKVEEITSVKGPFIFTLGWEVEVEVANGPQKTGTAVPPKDRVFFFFNKKIFSNPQFEYMYVCKTTKHVTSGGEPRCGISPSFVW